MYHTMFIVDISQCKGVGEGVVLQYGGVIPTNTQMDSDIIWLSRNAPLAQLT